MPADSESIIEIENRGECANDDGDNNNVIDVVEQCEKIDDTNTKDIEIKIDDVPEQIDSQNNHENSLGENENETNNAYNDLTSNDDESQTSISTTNSFGGSEFIRKQWHRRLRTPVWARCSINIHFSHNTHTLSLSHFLSLFLVFYFVLSNLNFSAFPFTQNQ